MIATDDRFPRHASLARMVEDGLPSGELAHDALHIERVYRWCLRLALEAGASTELAGAAGLVHDLVQIPKHSPDRPLGGEASARAAGGVLQAAGYTADERARVVEAVRTSSWSRGWAATVPEGVVLQDADRLDALGVVGFMRCVACQQHMAAAGTGGRLYDPVDPFATSGRPLDDRRQAIDHCYAKLLRLVAGMQLPTAETEARRRHASLQRLLADLARELDAAD